jgi:MFS superfamily sulfate permease-like transporter
MIVIVTLMTSMRCFIVSVTVFVATFMTMAVAVAMGMTMIMSMMLCFHISVPAILANKIYPLTVQERSADDVQEETNAAHDEDQLGLLDICLICQHSNSPLQFARGHLTL